MNKNEYRKMYELEDLHFWFLGKRFFADSVLLKYKTHIKKILDLGSGTGGMTAHLKKYGKVTGIETSKIARDLSKKRKLNIKNGSAEKIKFKNNIFDLVTIFDVLYHKNIKSEKQVILESKRVLKRGGYLLITDSAFNFLKSYHDKATHGKARYKLSDIVQIIENQGFTIVRSSYIFFSLFPVVLIKRFVLHRFRKRGESDVKKVPDMLNKFLIFILKIEAYLLRYFSFPLGTSLLILARKK